MPILALLAAISAWLSAGTLAVSGGGTTRIAALPPLWVLVALLVVAAALTFAIRLRLEQAWPLGISLLLWLPFMPGPIPSAFLIWQGPAESLVWAAVVAGLVVARPPTLPQLFADPKRAPWMAAVIIAGSAALIFSQVRGVVPGGDEPHYLAATQSLIGDGDLRVANNYANGDYLDYFPGRLEPHFLTRAASGEIYSIHAPGVSVVVLPAFAIAGYRGAVLTMILMAALTTALTWRLAFRLAGSAAGAWFGVAAVFASAPYFFHTFTIYPEIVGGFSVMCGVWLLLELADQRVVTRPLLAGVGAALAVLPWLHSRFAVLAGLLGVMLVIRLARGANAVTRIATFLAVPVVAGATWFGFFWLIYDTPSPIAPYGVDTSTSASYMLRGLVGLLVDQQFGVITTAPAYLAAIAGTIALARQRPRVAIELSLVVVVYALTVASYAMWWAGSAAPARLLVAILPLAALPMAMLAGRGQRTHLWVCLILLLVSVALVLPRALVENGRFIFNSRGSMDATLEWLSPIVDLPLALPSVHRDGGSVAFRDGVGWLVVLVFAGAVGRLVQRPRALAWTVTTLAFACGSMVAASLVWQFHRVTATTEDRSKLAALAQFRPWHPTLLDISGRRSMSQSEFLEAMTFRVPRPDSRINRLPAGEFTIKANPASRGAVEMLVGRNDPPIETRVLSNEDGFDMHLRLPVSVQALNVRPLGELPADAQWLRVTPVRLFRPAIDRLATRATRFGHARAFFFDDWAYLERDGFWTRAHGMADVVIDTDDRNGQSGLTISITAGAVATTVSVSVGEWEQSFSLTPGQRQEARLPPAETGSWRLRIRSGAGFRPSEREPGNRDVRLLAAWIAVH